jgi:hypothetical protein
MTNVEIVAEIADLLEYPEEAVTNEFGQVQVWVKTFALTAARENTYGPREAHVRRIETPAERVACRFCGAFRDEDQACACPEAQQEALDY